MSQSLSNDLRLQVDSHAESFCLSASGRDFLISVRRPFILRMTGSCQVIHKTNQRNQIIIDQWYRQWLCPLVSYALFKATREA